MNIKEIIKFRKINFKEIGSNVFNFWNKSYKIIFFAFFLLAAFLGSYLCYAYLLKSGWSESKKNTNSSAQSNGVEFKEDDFNKLVNIIQKEKDNYSAPYQPIKDIFKPYQ